MILCLTLGALGMSYLGVLHPVGDSLAVFRLWLGCAAIGLALLSWIVGQRRLGLFGFVAGMLATVPIALAYRADTNPQSYAYSVYQKNMRFNAQQPSQIIADVLSQAPDFVTLQEVSRQNRQVLDRLDQYYPSMQFCDFAGVGGTAAFSRWPIVPGSGICAAGYGIAGMQVATPDGPVWVVSVHLHWPYPYGQSGQVERLLPLLETMAGPAVVGGDFNMVPWSSALGKFARATRTQRSGHLVTTLTLQDGWLPLPIDHILTPRGDGQLTTRPRLTSDHLGLLLRFDL